MSEATTLLVEHMELSRCESALFFWMIQMKTVSLVLPDNKAWESSRCVLPGLEPFLPHSLLCLCSCSRAWYIVGVKTFREGMMDGEE